MERQRLQPLRPFLIFFLIKMLCMTFLMLSFTVKVLGTISKILVKTMKVDILFKSMHIFDQ